MVAARHGGRAGDAEACKTPTSHLFLALTTEGHSVPQNGGLFWPQPLGRHVRAAMPAPVLILLARFLKFAVLGLIPLPAHYLICHTISE